MQTFEFQALDGVPSEEFVCGEKNLLEKIIMRILRNCGLLAVMMIAFGIVASAQVNVNPGAGSYTTLKGAFDAINLGTHTGAVTVDIVGDTTEVAVLAAPSMVLNASGVGAASYSSIVISPSGGAARTISGVSTAGFPMIDFVGADNVTINGLNTAGNSLTISNTLVSATSGTGTIRFQTDATNNTITNSSILGSATMAVGTNGGNISFASAAVTTGNDNNTVSNCNLGPAGLNLPSKVLNFSGSSNTDPGTANSGITITSNNIFDYFGAAVASAGIDINTGTVGTIISNNKFYQTATRTQTTAAQHSAIRISNTSGNNYQITGNTIGFASSAGTGTYTFVGLSTSSFVPVNLSVGTIAATSVQGNTIAGIAMSGTSAGTTSSAPFRAIFVGSGLATIGDITGNTIGSQSAIGSITYTSSATTTSELNVIYNNGSSNWVVNNNTIGGITAANSSTGASNIFGIRATTSTSATFNATNNTIGGTVANSIQSTSTSTSSQVVGIGNTSSTFQPVSNFSGNTIRNMSVAGGTGTTTSASLIGILLQSATVNTTLSQNTIFNLANSNATAATIVTGIQFNSGGSANVVERNFIHSITSATNSATAEVNGIRVGGGTTIYRNNMIAIGAGIPNALGSGGPVSLTGGISGINEPLGTDSFFHNSVYIGGSPTSGVGPSFAFNSSQTVNTRSFRNNIFFNARSNSGATGKNYVVRVAGSAPNPTGLTINNNNYFANGTGAVFGIFNNLDVLNLGAWKLAVGQDANSFETNPQFVDPTNALPDLHISSVNPTAVEGNGVDVGVTNDFDGQIRSGLTPVDIGADAGNFVSSGDLGAPSITYSVLPNTTMTTNRPFAISVVDSGSGVPTIGIGLPVLYFRKGTSGAYSSAQCAFGSGSTYDCTFDYSLVGGVVAGNTIQYFVVAQDAAAIPNAAVNPSTGAGGLSTNPPAVVTPPTTPNSYLIASAFTGSYDVPVAYTSLTNVGGIFEALNNGVLTGNVTINVTADLTGELGTVALNQLAEEPSGSNFTVTIKPSGGAARTITGSSTAGLITLNGADRISIDGTTTTPFGSDAAGDNLTIINTNAGTSSAVIWVQTATGSNGATNNTFKNLNLVGNSSTTTLIGIGFGGVGVGTSSLGTGNNNNRVESCDIQKVQTGIYSQGASATVKNTGNVITQNVMNAVSPNNIGLGGIRVGFESGIEISQNIIANTDAGSTSFGITLGTVPSNTFTTFTGNEVTGAKVNRNSIDNIVRTGDGTAIGIGVAAVTSTAAAANTISNNGITRVRSTAATPSDFAVGILLGGGTTGGTNVYYNSVSMSGACSNSSPCFAIVVGGVNPVVDLRNNIFSNTATSTSGKIYSIGFAYSAPYTNLTSNNNDFYTNSLNFAVVGGLGNSPAGDRVDLLALQTETGKDVNSVSGNPMFVSTTDIHISNTNMLLVDKGAVVSVLDDFDGQIRSVVGFAGGTPDIGADEALAPTAASASVRGRLISAFGRNLANAGVAITNTSTGETKYTRSNQLGFFNFQDLQTGSVYVVSVQSKRFIFANHIFTLNEDLTDLVLTAQANDSKQ
jgi:trimeric autotransporter adhesin